MQYFASALNMLCLVPVTTPNVTVLPYYEAKKVSLDIIINVSNENKKSWHSTPLHTCTHAQ